MLSINDIKVVERKQKEPDKLFLVASITTQLEVFVPKSQRGKPAAMKTINADIRKKMFELVYGDADKVLTRIANQVPDADLLT